VSLTPETIARVAEYLAVTWTIKRDGARPTEADRTKSFELSTLLQMTLPCDLWEVVVNSVAMAKNATEHFAPSVVAVRKEMGLDALNTETYPVIVWPSGR
jgi:hypothetical protein